MKQTKENVSHSYVINKITNSLLELLKKYSLKEISISGLCEYAGISRASFYRNFKSKEDILKKYDENLIKLWGKEYENNPASTIENLIPSLMLHYKTHQNFYNILYKENLSNIILNNILYACKINEKESNMEAYAASFIGYGLFGVINEWIARGMIETEDELMKILKNK